MARVHGERDLGGTYDVEVRVASSGTGGTFHIEVNGVNKTGSFTVPDTGGWQNWVTISKTGLTLTGPAGFQVVLDSNGPNGAVGNFHYLRVAASSSGSGGSVGSTAYTGRPDALPGTIQAENFDNGAEGIGNHDLSAQKSGGDYRATGVDIVRRLIREAAMPSDESSPASGSRLPSMLAQLEPTKSTHGSRRLERAARFRSKSAAYDRERGPQCARCRWMHAGRGRKTGLGLSAGQQVERLSWIRKPGQAHRRFQRHSCGASGERD